MLKTLVIYLMNETELPCWEAEGVLHQGDLADLQSLAKHRRVIVVVPGEAVLLLHPHLPVMSRARVRQAIPFAVEEQLIDNLEAYHFAIADRQTEGTVPVAVVSDAAMKAWCARLAEWQIMPHVMVPLTLILPYQAGEWHAYQHQHALTVRTGPYEGFTCESAEVNTYLAAAGYDAAWPLYTQTDLPRIHRDTAVPINLLQGSYATQHTSRFGLGPSWRMVFSLGVIWVGLSLLGPLVSYAMLHHRLHTLQADLHALLQQAKPVPSVPPMTDEALLTLGKISQSFSHTPGITFKKIEFDNHVYELTLRAMTKEDLVQFTQGLTTQQLQVKQETEVFVNGRINAVMRVT